MSERTYAQFNSLTITGRVSHAELVTHQGTEFLAVTLLSGLKDDADAIAVKFNTTNGLMGLYKKGWLNNGRSVTVTGHLQSFSELYFDQKLGKTKRLQRPVLKLSKAQVFDGGLGPAKKKSEDIEIDEAPALETAGASEDF